MIRAETIRAEADVKWADIEQLDDLRWDLGAISNRREAINFLTQFENRFCVYSPYVEKLYTSYHFIVPDEAGYGHVTVLPDPRAYHDTFNEISVQAVEETGIYIFPGEAIGRSGLFVKIPPKAYGRSKELPFADGLRQLIQDYRKDDSFFLPVLQNGDLREYENSMPSLHLHRLNVDMLADAHSELTINQLRNTIADNLIGLFQQFQKERFYTVSSSTHTA